ncbi:MAG: ribonuclease III [Desulfosarcinaceae bacterium]|nr:ribonuclease III [Desulfosarcinaceae bacterium]
MRPRSDDIAALENRLGYRFNDRALLVEALRHSSWVNEHPQENRRDNERLEFLGDAVLNLIIGQLLMQTYPDMREGDLSRTRAKLVSEPQLAALARQLDLGRHLRLGKGEAQTDGRDKSSLLADAFEAALAALYLDGGLDTAAHVVQQLYQTLLRDIPSHHHHSDYKSRLQEAVQLRHQAVPSYQVVGESGPDHRKIFRVAVRICGLTAEGEGGSKKKAEQAAAQMGLARLKEAGLIHPGS